MVLLKFAKLKVIPGTKTDDAEDHEEAGQPLLQKPASSSDEEPRTIETSTYILTIWGLVRLIAYAWLGYSIYLCLLGLRESTGSSSLPAYREYLQQCPDTAAVPACAPRKSEPF